MKITLPSVLFALLETAALAQNHGGNLRKEKAVSPAPVQKKYKKVTPARVLNEKKKFKPPTSNVNNQNYDTRIVGGGQSDVGEFPYFVDLKGCGGSLIALNIVLTAAHCDPSGSDFVNKDALVGAYQRQQESYGAEFVKIATQKVHPQYNAFTLANDFQLLRLSDKVVSATPVTLSLNDHFSSPADGAELTVLGVGLTNQDGSESSPFLRDVDVQVVNIDECNIAYKNQVIENVMFCAGYPQGGKDACQGDSGGPIVKRIGNEHVQIGLVSSGSGCAEPGFPGIYARVSSAHGWIKQVVCDEWGESASFCDGGSQPTGGNGPSFTYKTDTICSQRFCDAFFENDSICVNSGDGSALIYKEDGNCGIDIRGPADVTCSVECHQDPLFDTESPGVAAISIAIVVGLALAVVGCAVWQCRRYSARSKWIAVQQIGKSSMAIDEDQLTITTASNAD
jgi:trypsin